MIDTTASNSSKTQIKVAFFPGDGWHAYQQSMADALKNYDINAYQGGAFNNAALIADNSDILHFHWVERLWDAEGFWQQIKLLAGVYRYLSLAKKLGKKVVWTVHNHYPHENARKPHVLGLKLFAKFCDAIYVHSEWSQQWVTDNLKPNVKPTIVYHGNFAEFFNFDVDVENYRKQYLQPEQTLVGILGTIRKNRGYEQTIQVFRQSQRQDLRLLIAGKSIDPDYLQQLKTLAGDSKNIVFDTRHFTDPEYQQVSSACDILLLNYSDITTSGALLSAWSNGTSVITSDLPYFRELVGTLSPAGVVLPSNTETQLIQCIDQLLKYDESERTAACLDRSNRYTWDETIQPMVSSYRAMVRG